MLCASGGNHGSRSWLEVTVRQARLVSHALREWGKPRQSLMGGTPFGGAAFPRPRKSR
ncbi:MAG: hypothetical protein F6J99_22165 [Moorea sp. SIO4G3]|nr:hypothetical protein [Moorena sp. SIO4G3]